MTRRDRPLTGPYWAAVDERKLVRPHCADCDRSHFSPQVVCPWCRSSNWRYEASSGLGTVYSHTTIHRPPSPEFVAPYVVADIDMDEGWRTFAWVVGCAPSAVAIGMRVAVSFVEGIDGELVPAFAPGP